MDDKLQSEPEYVAIEELRVGLYVHLDLSWMEHNFARNSFKIRDKAQIEEIKKLGLNRVRIDPSLSDHKQPPSAPVAAKPVAPKAPQLSPEETALLDAKKARVERLNQQIAAVAHCKKEFLKAANTLKNISLNLFSRPQEAHRDADQLVQQMLDSLLTDKDIAIHLMNDKGAGEENYYHSLNVAVLAMLLGKELALPSSDIKLLGMGCLFHDIGKVEIPDWVVLKTTPLTRAEKHLLQQHCQYGETIAHKIGLPPRAIDIITQHHECIDGSGYPNHLKGDQISPLAGIVAIANTYDNHCNRPNPADSLSPYEALSTMFARQRAQFDPGPLSVFIRCMGVYPPGTIVKLSNNSLGMVVSVNSGKPLRPSILIYDPQVPKEEALIIDLLNEPELNVTASMKAAQLPREVYDYLSPRKRMMYFFDKPKNDARTRP